MRKKSAINASIKIILLAVALVASSFLLQGTIGISFSDEGYLWYGTWRSGLGDVPMRDFQSYDPGRYYWVAFWSLFLGDGILALRISLAIFQTLGLICGMLVLRRLNESWHFLFFGSLLLLLWMYPRHKLFGHSLTMAAVYLGVLLVERPSLRRHFFTGLGTGLAAFFGRNHGLYWGLAFSGLILYIALKERKGLPVRQFGAWGAGTLAGYAPMLGMFICIPGFWQGFIRTAFGYFFLQGGTHNRLPVPWLWTLQHDSFQLSLQSAHVLSTSLLFTLLPFGYLVLALYVLFRANTEHIRRCAPCVAGLFVGIPYLHQVFDRADLGHLALGIHPFLIALLSLPFLSRSGLCAGRRIRGKSEGVRAGHHNPTPTLNTVDLRETVRAERVEAPVNRPFDKLRANGEGLKSTTLTPTLPKGEGVFLPLLRRGAGGGFPIEFNSSAPWRRVVRFRRKNPNRPGPEKRGGELYYYLCIGMFIAMFIFSLFSVGVRHPYTQMAIAPPHNRFIPFKLRGDRLWIAKTQADFIQTITRVQREYIQEKQGILIAPDRPILYPILERKSPVWELFFTRAQPKEIQEEMIADLERDNVCWVLLHNVAIDGREDRRFSVTHSLVWAYIREHFREFALHGLPAGYTFLQRDE